MCECVEIELSNRNKHVLTLLSKKPSIPVIKMVSAWARTCVCVCQPHFCDSVIQIFHWLHFRFCCFFNFSCFHLFIALFNFKSAQNVPKLFKPVKIWFEFMKMIFFGKCTFNPAVKPPTFLFFFHLLRR